MSALAHIPADQLVKAYPEDKAAEIIGSTPEAMQKGRRNGTGPKYMGCVCG